jgi:hypothetical protein
LLYGREFSRELSLRAAFFLTDVHYSTDIGVTLVKEEAQETNVKEQGEGTF